MAEKHALIIDDNNSNMNVLVRLLDKENVSSTRVLDPKQLKNALQSIDSIDVVFLDLEMPMIDGFQVFDQLKADARFDNVPIIAYTVHVSELSEAHKYGFDGFLGKPLDSDRFPGQLRRIFNGEGVWETV
ncbi:MAG: response regulator [Chloroflexi bacterium]|nr:response regulator [Chloroflexota bacterium]